MDEINKRIIELMIKSGHSKSTFAKELGVSLPLITHITSGRNKPGLELLQRIMQVFPNVNPEWLLLGESTMFKEKPKQIDISHELAQLTQLNDKIMNTLEVFNTTKAYHKLLLDELLHLQEIDIINEAAKADLERIASQISTLKQQINIKLKD